MALGEPEIVEPRRIPYVELEVRVGRRRRAGDAKLVLGDRGEVRVEGAREVRSTGTNEP